MIDAFSSSLSGVVAASQRVAVAADNIANLRSTAVTRADDTGSRRNAAQAPNPPPPPPAKEESGGAAAKAAAADDGFAPRRVVQHALAGGGTVAETQSVEPPSVPEFAPDAPDADENGIVQRPNVSIEREFAEMVRSQRAFEASLTALETADKIRGRLIDIRS